VDYTLALPMYVVTLPCGHEFRSITRVTTNMSDTDAFDVDPDEDAEDITWLYCRTCHQDYAVEGWELEEYQDEPQYANGKRLGEKALGRRYDEALVKNKVAAVLLKTQGSVPLAKVAADIDAELVRTQSEDGVRCHLRTVERVAADLRALSKYPASDEIEVSAEAA